MQKKVIQFIGVVFLIALFLFSLYKKGINEKELLESRIILSGTIINNFYARGMKLKYYFVYNSRKIIATDEITNYGNENIGKFF
jgi:hypothetical protein